MRLSPISGAFKLPQTAAWLVFAIIFGFNAPFFAQTSSQNDNASNLWSAVESLLGQPSNKNDQDLALNDKFSEALLAQAEAYIVSYKNDSAILVSNRMFHQLKRQNQLDSPTGLKVQLVLARALEHSDADSISLRLLQHVKARCQQAGPWETYVKCCLALALTEERRHHPPTCLEHLNLAKAAIDRHNLGALYPAYAMRCCSYYRVIVHNRDSAVLYARELLRTAPAQNMVLEEAWGHMLLSWLIYLNDGPNFLEHHHKAAALFFKIEDYTGLSYAFREISFQYSQLGDLKKALLYNDSSRIAAQKSMIQGNKWNQEGYRTYKFRADLFRRMGRPDSAWFYLNKGYEEELRIVREKGSAKVAEIDARYLNQIKTKQIQEQSELIDVEKKVNQLLLLVLGMMLLFAVGLIVGLAKLKKERRLLAEKNRLIQHQTEELQLLDIAKSRFFANISHELRTPLTLLTSPVKTLLKESQLTEKQTRLLQMAESSGKQLNQLINEILDLRKLEMGKMTIVAEPTELRTWFQPYFAQFESLAEQNNIAYSVTFAMPTQVTADLDREKYRQILFNLLSNAFKFTPQGGHIDVQVQVSEQQMQLQVANSGSGIHPEDLPYVFDRYFQSTRPDKPVEGGTGIGLALCREYVQLLGGTISAASTPGTETIFRVALPLHLLDAGQVWAMSDDLQETTPTISLAGTDPGSGANKQGTILLVEDNPDLRDYIRLILQDTYQVVTAENGQAALATMHNDKADKTATTPDLILSDLMMPVMDGYQLLEKLKSDNATRHIPVVMLTARAEIQDKLKALRIGVDDYVTKPFDEEELLARIGNLLKHQSARRSAVAEDLSLAETTAAPTMSQPDRQWLETFEAYVQKHYSSDLLSVASLAYEFAMSESTLLRQLKRLTGLSPQQYLQEVRLHEARQLLENRTFRSIAQVASKVGYDDARTFARSFKQRFGKLPSEVLES